MKKIIAIPGLIALALGLIVTYVFWHLHSTTLEASPFKHLAIIMDGNRRWARQHGKAAWLGHKQGAEPVKTAIKFCLEYKIPYLTLYAFSLENFKRSKEELDYLFNVLAQNIVSQEFSKLYDLGVKVRFVGERSLFPAHLVPIINDVEEKSKNGTNLTLNILFCYGGQQEIVNAARLIAHDVLSGVLKPENINETTFQERLWLGPIPAPDLIIRTGRLKRLSNFLSYQSAYSELYFMDCYWPEVTRADLIKAALDYKNRKRTFGG